MIRICEVAGGLKTAFTASGVETPIYQVVRRCKGYEERSYLASAWVSTKVTSMSMSEARSTAFWRLFKYIQGENNQGIQIPMTAPVTTKVVPGAGPNCESSFTMAFYIGVQHSANPPSPTNPQVFLHKQGPQQVYVRQFGGFAKEADWIQEAHTLAQILPISASYEKDFYYTVGYDAPHRIHNRTNEIWFLKR